MRSTEARPLPEVQDSDTVDVDPSPRFAILEPHRWIVVAAVRRDHRHVVTGGDQRQRDIGQMLRGGDAIGMERLVEKEDSHVRIDRPRIPSGARQAAAAVVKSYRPATLRLRSGSS